MHWSGTWQNGCLDIYHLTHPFNVLLDFYFGWQFTGTLELAALGPTMLIFNLFTYIFTAITITTVR